MGGVGWSRTCTNHCFYGMGVLTFSGSNLASSSPKNPENLRRAPPPLKSGTTNSGAGSRPKRVKVREYSFSCIEWYFNVYYLQSFDSLQYDLLNEFQHLLRFKMVELLAKTFNETVQIMKCEARRRSWGERLTFERWQQACVLGLGHLPPLLVPFLHHQSCLSLSCLMLLYLKDIVVYPGQSLCLATPLSGI